MGKLGVLAALSARALIYGALFFGVFTLGNKGRIILRTRMIHPADVRLSYLFY